LLIEADEPHRPNPVVCPVPTQAQICQVDRFEVWQVSRVIVCHRIADGPPDDGRRGNDAKRFEALSRTD
jgi:hypothetical protein